ISSSTTRPAAPRRGEKGRAGDFSFDRRIRSGLASTLVDLSSFRGCRGMTGPSRPMADRSKPRTSRPEPRISRQPFPPDRSRVAGTDSPTSLGPEPGRPEGASMSDDTEEMRRQLDGFRADFEALRREVGKVIVGQEEIIDGALTALISGGHVLLEGVPGL